MPMPLNESQRAFLGNPEQVSVFARWVLASGNQYARILRTQLGLPLTPSPTQIHIAKLTAHLSGPEDEMNTSCVVRLINIFSSLR